MCANVATSCGRVAKGIFDDLGLENVSFDVFEAGGKLEAVSKAGERFESEGCEELKGAEVFKYCALAYCVASGSEAIVKYNRKVVEIHLPSE